MYVVATYQGGDGFQGLNTGKQYVLKVLRNHGWGSNVIEVTDTYPRVKLPYESMYEFFRTWDVNGRLGHQAKSHTNQ